MENRQQNKFRKTFLHVTFLITICKFVKDPKGRLKKDHAQVVTGIWTFITGLGPGHVSFYCHLNSNSTSLLQFQAFPPHFKHSKSHPSNLLTTILQAVKESGCSSATCRQLTNGLITTTATTFTTTAITTTTTITTTTATTTTTTTAAITTAVNAGMQRLTALQSFSTSLLLHLSALLNISAILIDTFVHTYKCICVHL
ncbi:unnamed protein product [Brugia pahangi]|uniref:Uncharacterized protein n=1 Tax=Brugia pahangi TaxID=6280 RepID=A0A0N4TJF5_BRUPA|nr:unnamed protein product [Brugia pahangi]